MTFAKKIRLHYSSLYLAETSDKPEKLDAGLPCAWRWLQLSAGT